MENNIQNARALFNENKFAPALEMCLALIEQGIDKKDAFLIAAKSYMLGIKSPMNASDNKTIIKTFQGACAEAKTLEEALELEYEMTSAAYLWEATGIKQHLADVLANPTLEQWRKYIVIFPEYSKMRLFISMAAGECNAVKTYCEQNGIEDKDYNEKIKQTFGDKYNASALLTKEEIEILEFNTARSIFENTMEKYAANREGNTEFMQKVAKVLIYEFATIHSIIDHSLPKKGTNPDVRCERLKFKAEVITFYAEAMLYPNGKPVSMCSGDDRAEKLATLKEIYAELQAHDSNFVPPELPSELSVQMAQKSQSSGGCYVATAVYGSYDCPEVWTLRRFRDYTLSETWYGRAFIHTYYAISPTLVKWFGETKWFKNLWKPTLDRMVERLNNEGVENTPYNDRSW